MNYGQDGQDRDDGPRDTSDANLWTLARAVAGTTRGNRVMTTRILERISERPPQPCGTSDEPKRQSGLRSLVIEALADAERVNKMLREIDGALFGGEQ